VNQIGVKTIEESRPFYESKEKAASLQLQLQTAAIKFERACQLVDHAKETITVAEQRFQHEPHTEFDTAWQEMLNQATAKVIGRILFARIISLS